MKLGQNLVQYRALITIYVFNPWGLYFRELYHTLTTGRDAFSNTGFRFLYSQRRGVAVSSLGQSSQIFIRNQPPV
jgi:hypothetical protein